ncbi:MAG: nodulation protein NfeD [Acidobacteriaceae bacterium]|jgi:membrane-bound serine protease (ClpP class)|nr:nodulation protein NfeD [Acidobacteriaceae bacterium]
MKFRLLAFAAIAFLLAAAVCASAQSNPVVLKLTVRDTIQPVSAGYIQRGLSYAADTHASAVLIELDTPGGLLDSTRDIVQHILQSPVPVIVFISPAGSRAGSAGFFILEAADIAAMSPGTNAGAAHPILEGKTMDPVLKQKIENDAAAFLRSYTVRRGRNADAAEDAVRNSKSYSDSEALSLKLIDAISSSDIGLFALTPGLQLKRFDGTPAPLNLNQAHVQEFPPSLREHILGKLMDPNIAILLLFAGALLIYLEFHVPGTILPGSIGTLLVLLALFALNLLPIHFASVTIMLAALVLLVLEAKFPSHGVLALTGSIALIFSLLTLVNGPIPEQRVHPAVAIATGLSFGLITSFLALLALRARRNKLLIGPAALLGATAIAQTPLAPSGQVLVRGELWQAQLEPPTASQPAGAAVRVIAVENLLLTVRGSDSPATFE